MTPQDANDRLVLAFEARCGPDDQLTGAALGEAHQLRDQCRSLTRQRDELADVVRMVLTCIDPPSERWEKDVAKAARAALAKLETP